MSDANVLIDNVCIKTKSPAAAKAPAASCRESMLSWQQVYVQGKNEWSVFEICRFQYLQKTENVIDYSKGG